MNGTAPREFEVLLQTSPAAAEALVDRLRGAGVEAELVDRPGVLALLLAFGTYRVRIGVPVAEASRARDLLAQWEPGDRAQVRKLSRHVYRQFLVAFGVGLIVGGTRYARHRDAVPQALAEGLFAWFATLVVWGLWSRRR